MIPLRSRHSPGPPSAPLVAVGSVGPLRLLEPSAMGELGDVLARAMSLGIIWSSFRRPAVLDLASAAAHKRARLYLIGPPDLGQDLGERSWLRDHAGRLLSRRGLDCAADLILLNSGSDRCVLLFLHEGPRSFWLWLSERQAEAAADWFSHLFWHQTFEEGRSHGAGYRFQRCGPPPFTIPALPPDSPLWLTTEPLPPAAPAQMALLHDPETAPELGLPPFAVSEFGGHIDARATAGSWSVRLRLDGGQATDLYSAATVLLRGR